MTSPHADLPDQILSTYAEHDWVQVEGTERFVCTMCSKEVPTLDIACLGPPHVVAGERLRWLDLVAQRRTNDLLAQLIRVLKEQTHHTGGR